MMTWEMILISGEQVTCDRFLYIKLVFVNSWFEHQIRFFLINKIKTPHQISCFEKRTIQSDWYSLRLPAVQP